MSEGPKREARKEAAEYWASHGIDELGHEAEEVEVDVKRPLSTVLSIRIDGESMSKLKLMAKTQDIGVTTMARKLLKHALNSPDSSLSPAMRGMPQSPTKPPPPGEPTYLVLPRADLDNLTRWFIEAVQENSLPVSPDDSELIDKLRALERA